MLELVRFNITDLRTLDTLLEIQNNFASRPFPSIPLSFKSLLFPHIKKLDITLRLPLLFFEAVDGSGPGEEGSVTPVFEDELNLWISLPQRFLKFKGLQSLRIWLDHTDKVYWSVVNERAILSQY